MGDISEMELGITELSLPVKHSKCAPPLEPMCRILNFLVGLVLIYLGFYFNNVLTQRAQISNDLAQYYASAASEYYSARDITDGVDANTNPDLYKIGNTDYKDFLFATTRLAGEVPPVIRCEILSIEDDWEKIKVFDDASENMWFSKLDKIRLDVIDSMVYHKWFNPFWK